MWQFFIVESQYNIAILCEFPQANFKLYVFDLRLLGNLDIET